MTATPAKRWKLVARSFVKLEPRLSRTGSKPGLIEFGLTFDDGLSLKLRFADLERLEASLTNALSSQDDTRPGRFMCFQLEGKVILRETNSEQAIALPIDEATRLRDELKRVFHDANA